MRITTFGMTLALAAVLTLSGTALAGRPTSSLSLVVLGSAEITALSAIVPSQGDQVTFDVSTTQTDRPFVHLRCYQDDAFVYDGWHGFFEGYVLEPAFTLSSDYWTDGAANCVADLVSWPSSGRIKTLATTTFDVSA